MKRTALAAAALVAATLAGPPSAAAQSWRGDANVLLARKGLNGDEWGPVDRQDELGVLTDFGRTDWPVALAADLLVSGRDTSIASDGFNTERGRTSELDLGVRKIWRPDENLRPYVGGGLAFASADLEFSGPFGTVSDHDGGAGIWLGGGVSWTLSHSFNVGFDARASHAEVRLFDRDRNAGGFHLGLLLGYHWGG